MWVWVRCVAVICNYCYKSLMCYHCHSLFTFFSLCCNASGIFTRRPFLAMFLQPWFYSILWFFVDMAYHSVWCLLFVRIFFFNFAIIVYIVIISLFFLLCVLCWLSRCIASFPHVFVVVVCCFSCSHHFIPIHLPRRPHFYTPLFGWLSNRYVLIWLDLNCVDCQYNANIQRGMKECKFRTLFENLRFTCHSSIFCLYFAIGMSVALVSKIDGNPNPHHSNRWQLFKWRAPKKKKNSNNNGSESDTAIQI